MYGRRKVSFWVQVNKACVSLKTCILLNLIICSISSVTRSGGLCSHSWFITGQYWLWSAASICDVRQAHHGRSSLCKEKLSQIVLVLLTGFEPLVIGSIGSWGRRSNNWATTSPNDICLRWNQLIEKYSETELVKWWKHGFQQICNVNTRTLIFDV